MLALGLSRRAIENRLVAGRLFRLHRGVYAVGRPELLPLAREAAALLACRGRALLTHRSAGSLWAVRASDPAEPVDVTAVGSNPGARPGIRLHRVAALDARDVTTRKGLPVASAALTLVQLAAVLSPRELARAYDEALVRRVTGREAIEAALARNPRRRGAPALRRLLASEQPPRFTRSEAERRLLELVDAAGLPRPETNVRIHGHEVDALWRADGLVVEVDGYRLARLLTPG